MKIPSIRPAAVVIAAAAAILASSGLDGVASAAPAGSAPVAHPAPYPGVGTTSLAPATPVTSGGAIAAVAAACTPYVDGDNPHLSSGDVSAHGWWYRGSCANQKTTVYIGLQEFYSDGSWRTKATSSAYVWPGGGSGNRATARHVCESVVPAGWRSYVIVRLGNGASANLPSAGGLNLACRTLT
jgi:hypothetical protein